MSDKKIVTGDSGEVVIAKAKDFWTRNSKAIMIVCGAIILLAGGWLVYKNYVKEPKNIKASEAMYKAEEYYRMDSCNLALNGDGQHMGFIRIISRYSGTDAANLAHFYAGTCSQRHILMMTPGLYNLISRNTSFFFYARWG